ncbi:endoplasmic oxidoreductin [Rhizodiscina lignyota]|uniref:Endoplasmic oxidoreductin n=1 Tax=Rhizodiscina lignyota TaxID=1504668 RepID=A0A9P4IHL5_9PEZI|nr:endoplasmic oxidoreductin [Rhizodiscina lignyota]
MRKAERLFYLAVFALLGSAHAESSDSAPTASKNNGPNVCAYEPGAIVSDACASYSTLDDLNADLRPYIDSLTQKTDFFSYYRLNLYNKKCPFWSDDNDMCGNIACAVNTLENEEDIPLVWRAKELGKLQGPKAQHPGRKIQAERPSKPLQGELGADVGESCVVEYDDECDERDYCVPEDESASAKGDYVSLVDNPERYTGYMGVSAQQVWEAIYRENCFSTPQDPFSDTASEAAKQGSFGPSSPSGFSNPQQLHAAQDLRGVIKQHGLQQGMQQAIARGTPTRPLDDGLEFEDSCMEKRVFYRVVSGMHTSISAHICNEYLNRTTGEWVPNLQCYVNRLHTHPERISNLYFNYALLLRAAGKLRDLVPKYTFCSADPKQDAYTKELVVRLAQAIPPGSEIFDESVMFNGNGALGLKEDFRNRFRNISRIMDCVGCDKCRLWGKLQTAGYGTALKILFEFDEKNPSNNPPLRRHELVALVNTLGRVSNSLNAVKNFRDILAEQEHAKTVSRKENSKHGTSQAKNIPSSNDSDEAEVDDIEENDGPPRRRPGKPAETVTEIFWEEFDLVWRTFKYVLRSWVEMPVKLWRILIIELSRLWEYWLGLPVKPRSWKIHIPQLDEL